MALSRLDQLYRAVVLDHSSAPRHKGQLQDPTHQMELLNPTCGDAIKVDLKMEDNRIAGIAFNGIGCTISVASASMMTQTLLGKTREEAIELVHRFNQLVGGQAGDQEAIYETESTKPLLGDAAILEGVKNFPARYKCAILSWRAVEYALTQANDTEKLAVDGIERKRV